MQETLYKAYKTILDLHEKNGTSAKDFRKRIINKGQTARSEVEI